MTKPSIAETHPQVAAEFHPELNGNLRVDSLTKGSTKKVWWLGSTCKHEWDVAVQQRTLQGQGCPICKGKRILIGFNDLATTHPDLADQWHPMKNGDVTAQQVVAGNNRPYFWKGKCGHEWSARIIDRAAKNAQCPVCIGRLIVLGVNDLATTHPRVTKLWDHERNSTQPTQVVAGSRTVIQWKCDSGHKWQNPVYAETMKTSEILCPVCINRVITVGVNDMKTLYPECASQWDHALNTLDISTVSMESHEHAYWKCQAGHSYKREIRRQRISQGKCPFCTQRRLMPGFNDTATLFPKLVQEFHPTKNAGIFLTDYLPGNGTRVWWLCSTCNHEWETPILARARAGHGCPECANDAAVSVKEQAIANFLVSEGIAIEQSNRKILKAVPGMGAKELDIVVPSKMLAIEFNGLYWHSSAMGKGQDAHTYKLDACRKLGYRLVQVWEDDWTQREHVVKHVLKAALGVLPQHTSDVAVRDVSSADAQAFLDNRSLISHAVKSNHLGIFDSKNTLIAAISYIREGNVTKIRRFASDVAEESALRSLLADIENRHQVSAFEFIVPNCHANESMLVSLGFKSSAQYGPQKWVLVGAKRSRKASPLTSGGKPRHIIYDAGKALWTRSQ